MIWVCKGCVGVSKVTIRGHVQGSLLGILIVRIRNLVKYHSAIVSRGIPGGIGTLTRNMRRE